MLPLAVTPGEPAGIGPECVVRLAADHPEYPLIAVADPGLLRETASWLALDIDIVEWQPGDPLPESGLGCFAVPIGVKAIPGQLNPKNAAYVLETLRQAAGLVLEKHARAMVTAPVHKGIINDAGIPFSGHTEFLAQLSETPRVVMMLAAGDLRVALVTTHLPLSEVPAAITHEAVAETVRITEFALREQFHLPRPAIQVLGLNPHAGEGGHLGAEDDAIIAPVIHRLCEDGLNLKGPVPADTAFTPTALKGCDAVVAMYHDQGLPVLKHAGFGHAVNITLGLPFLRTSVDHGTALDIAGRGEAGIDSLAEAVKQAQRMTGPHSA